MNYWLGHRAITDSPTNRPTKLVSVPVPEFSKCNLMQSSCAAGGSTAADRSRSVGGDLAPSMKGEWKEGRREGELGQQPFHSAAPTDRF